MANPFPSGNGERRGLEDRMEVPGPVRSRPERAEANARRERGCDYSPKISAATGETRPVGEFPPRWTAAVRSELGREEGAE